MPAGRLELGPPLVDPDAGHDPVEGLTVEVDDPHDLAQALGCVVGHRFPDVALVQFGVTEEGDEATGRSCTEVGIDIASRRGREEGCRGSEAHRTGREVDLVGILGPRRVGLQPALGPQRRQVGLVESAQEVVDGVQHRRGVGLDADPIRSIEVGEPQCRHCRHQGGRTRLVAADLDPVTGAAVVVGRVDDAGAQPEHSLCDLVENLGVRARVHPGHGRSGHAEGSHRR